MTSSRRDFAKKVGLAVAAVGLAGSATNVLSQSLRSGDLFALSAESFADPLINFKSETFRPYIGTIFRSNSDRGAVSSLRLLEVTDQKIGPKVKAAAAGGENFSLIFRSVGKKEVPQDIHTFEHPSLGTFSLFLAPVERSGRTYEAVINHSVR